MKILIVCPRLCHGGAERVAVCLANGFADRGHKIRFMADLFEEQTFILDNRVKIVNLISTNNNKVQKWLGAIKNIRKEVKRDRPDVIIGIMYLCNLIAWVASIGLKIPVIATEHSAFERPPEDPITLKDKIIRFYINKIYSSVTLLTEADKDVVRNHLSNVKVMPNPLVLEPITKLPKKDKIIIAAGRVDQWYTKGLDVLIKAWSKIQTLNDNDDDNDNSWWLKIAGVWRNEKTIPYLTGLIPDGEWKNLNDKDDDNDNKSAVWRSDKYRIEFLGFRKDIEELYKKSSIFVLSSRYEGFGLVLIEAMSQGCAPIACDYKGRQREILSPLQGDSLKVDGYSDHGIEVTENGILCEPDDIEALAAGLKRMMEDEKYRKQVQQNAVERSKYYDMKHTMDRWESYLSNIILK